MNYLLCVINFFVMYYIYYSISGPSLLIEGRLYDNTYFIGKLLGKLA